MNEKDKLFLEEKLRGNTSIIPSIYYEDLVFNILDDYSFISYLVPDNKDIAAYTSAKIFSSSDVLVNNIKKRLPAFASDQGDIQSRWTILTDYLLPEFSPILDTSRDADDTEYLWIVPDKSEKSLLMHLLSIDECRFVALVNTDSCTLMVLKSDFMTIGHKVGLHEGPDPVIRSFDDLVPKEIAIIKESYDFAGESYDPTFCYALPINESFLAQEELHGHRVLPVPNYI